MFALTAVVYRQRDYLEKEIPQIAALKHKFWSHEGVVFHSYDINKKQGPFARCVNPLWRDRLRLGLADVFDKSTGNIIAAVIDKVRHKAQYVDPSEVYYLAVQFVLERVFMMAGSGVTIVFESRGPAEDKIVRGWCEKICEGGSYRGQSFGFDIHFATKATNIAGLQMADLACQPIIHFCQKPDTARPDWLAVKPRIRSDWRGRIEGRGLKVFPTPKS